jgi:hypothetical protein
LQNGGIKIQDKIKVAFVKFGGLSSGGTEKWLQMMATNMNNLKFEVTFFTVHPHHILDQTLDIQLLILIALNL